MSDNYNEEEIITDDVMQQKPEKKTLGLFAAESRGGLLIGIVILAVFAIVGGLGYLFLSKEAPKRVSAGAIKAESIVAEAGAKTHEAYKEAKRMENENRYKAAASRDGGVAMPFIFDDEEDEGAAGDIETCGCTLDDEQLIRAMQRLGLTGLQAGVDNMRVARSDVYVASDGRLMGGNGEPLQYKGQAIYMQSNGVLSDVNGNEYKTPSDITMYIGKQGEIIDATTRRVALRGDLMTSDGVVIMNDGKAANKEGNSAQVGGSDIYITRDRQLITLDGRPILNSGAIVFKDDEQLLVNKGDLAIAWEGRSVYQNNAGHLVDSRDNQFEREGILFTYSGILIDNSGKLTKPLADIKRVGLSDLYLARSGRLVDSSASPITHYGREVLLSRNKLHLAGGGNVQNRDKADLFLSEEGRISADVGKGAVQSGVLKASNGVAFDRSGELLSRRGRIERRGSSIFFTSSDGLLVDNEGRPILFKNKDTFLDWTAMLPDGSHALMTWDYEKVLSKDRYRVYLTPDGRLVDANGNAIQDTGMLVTAEGVAITSDGKTVLSEGLKRLTNESGLMMTADGREIFVDESGRLVDEFGNPILGADGQALFLDENGNIVDEFGRIVTDTGIQIASEQEDFTGLKVGADGVLRAKDGKAIMVDGQPVKVAADGSLVGADGKPILTADGRKVFVDEFGNLVDEHGNPVDPSEIGATKALGAKVSADGTLLSASGKPMLINGKPIKVAADGSLLGADGKPILTADGRKVFVDEHGNFVDEFGNIVDPSEIGIADSKGLKVGADGVLRTKDGKALMVGGKAVKVAADGSLLGADGKPILTADGRKVFADEHGNLVDEFGNPVDASEIGATTALGASVGADGTLLSASGKPMMVGGKPVKVGKDGSLLGADGKPILTADGRKVFVDEFGNLVDEFGKPVHPSEIGMKEGLGAKVSKSGALLSADGKPLLIDGKPIKVGKDGSLLGADGKQIMTKDGRKVFVDEHGNFVDEFGNIVDPSEIGVTEGLGAKVAADGTLLSSDGKALLVGGKPVKVGKDGSLLGADGKPIMTKDGRKVFVDEFGNLVDEHGNPVDPSEIGMEEGLGAKVAADGSLLSADGKALLVGGKPVKVGKDGSLLGADGKPIMTKDGRKVFVDKYGNLVDEHGNPVDPDEIGMTESLGAKVAADGTLLSADGKALLVGGKPVKVGKDGSLLGADGKPILTADGRKVFMDEHGNLVDEFGNIVDPSEIGMTESLGAKVAADGTLLSADGKALLVDGKPVKVGKDGSLLGADGKPILTADGRKVFVDEFGNLVDEHGNPVDPSEIGMTESLGARISADGILRTADGKPLMVDGKPVSVAADGSLLGADGKQIMTKDGRKVFVDEHGNFVDEFGNIVDPSEIGVTEGLGAKVAADGTLLSSDGKALLVGGKPVKVGKDGSLLGADGKPIMTKDGRKVFVDEFGNLVDEFGNPVDPDEIGMTTGEPSKFKVTSDGSVLRADGSPLLVKGQKVSVAQDGSLLGADGKPLLTKDGRKIFIDKDGNMVDQFGNIITEDEIAASGGIRSGLKAASDSESMKRLGSGNIHISKDGLLLDKDGKPLTYNGQKVRMLPDGRLVDEHGRVITDKYGNAVYMDKDGNLVDKDGRRINDSLLRDGSGVLLDASGKDAIDGARQLGSSDVFMARDGKLLGADGKPILYDGKEVFVGEDGQLYYADGRPVKDEFGNSVFVDPNTGAFVDKDGKPSKGLKLTNSDGVLLGADGQLITSGGKLTRIEGTNYFRTADGLIVDEFGRPVSNYRIDSEGRIVNQYGTPIRFKGREMYLNADGNLVDAAGNVLKDENEGALTVTGDGIANQEGQAVNLTTGQVDLEGSQEEAATGPVFESLVDRDRSAARVGEVAPPVAPAEDRRTTQQSQQGAPDSTAGGASSESTDKEEAITLDEDAIGRLTRRYQNLRNQMTRQLNAAVESENREAQGGMFSVSGEVSSGMGALELAEYEGNLEYELAKISKKYEGLTNALEPEEGAVDGSTGDYIYAKAGDTLYGITINAINSDASSTKVVAELVGVPMTSPLFGARVLGDFVFDDKGPWVGWVEVTFDQLCLRNQDECLDIEGMGIEPSDSSPLLSHKVNRHYWYRFSGLFLASMLEGTAEAMSEAGNRETENVGGNQTVIVTGLNGKKLALRSVGKIGERFADVFAQQVARPSTVRIKAGVELGIMLTKHVKGPTPTDDMSIFSDF